MVGDIMENVIQAWWWLQALPWETIVASLGTSAVIVTVTQFVKKRLNKKTKVKVLSIVGALAALPGVLDALLSNPLWLQYVPANFAWLATGAVALHALLETPVFRKLRAVLVQYKQALQVVREQDTVVTAPSAPVPSVTPVEEPEKPLVLNG